MISGHRFSLTLWLALVAAVGIMASASAQKIDLTRRDTADELNAVAKDLGVAASDIHLGSDASETTLKRTPLSDYPSELEDGLLTASEVAQLKLNADWVVLSASHGRSFTPAQGRCWSPIGRWIRPPPRGSPHRPSTA